MTTHQPPPDPDRIDEPLPGEAELAALYRQLPASEPGPELDAAVLRAAAEALRDSALPFERRGNPRQSGDRVHPQPAARRRRQRWLFSLSSAATVVLAAGIAWQVHRQPPAEAPATSMTLPHTDESAQPSAAPVAPPPPTVTAAPVAAAPQARFSRAQAKPVPLSSAPSPSMAPTSEAAEADAVLAESATLRTSTAARAANVATPGQNELRQIRQLLDQGEEEEARQRLEAFQRAHPQWPLPPDLQERLRQP